MAAIFSICPRSGRRAPRSALASRRELLGYQRPAKKHFVSDIYRSDLAPRVGFEPTTIRLTVGRSTTELPRNAWVALGAVPISERGSAGESLRRVAFCSRHERYQIAGRPPAAQIAPRAIDQSISIAHLDRWRARTELHRGTRICSPLRHHSATWPQMPLDDNIMRAAAFRPRALTHTVRDLQAAT